jgi:phage tail protein X
MTTTEYITKPGDRWDLIAYKAYGTVDDITLDDGSTVNAMSYIAQANPDISLDSVLTEGLLMQIPIVANSSVETDVSLLPPWKQ